MGIINLSDNPEDALSAATLLGRLFFLGELLACSIVYFGIGAALLHGDFHDFWPGAIFCVALSTTILVDNVVKRAFMHRRPFFGMIVSIILAVLSLALGIALASASWYTQPPPEAALFSHADGTR